MNRFPEISIGRRRRPPCRTSHATELIVLAADLSASMTDTFRLSNRQVTTRIQALKQAAAFFLDARSGFITGQTLFVCGGLTVGLAQGE